MKPDDPRVKSGRYHLCGCDYCNKSTYFRELERKQVEPQVQEVIHRHSEMGKQEFRKLQDIIGQIAFLQNKVTELSKPKQKPQRKPTGYKGLSV